MISCENFAVVVDHVHELDGQKKLAKGCDGLWYIWDYRSGTTKPLLYSFTDEKEAKKAYKAIVIPKSRVIYTPHPVPFLVNLDDLHWTEVVK